MAKNNHLIKVNFTNRGFHKAIRGTLDNDTSESRNIAHVANLFSDVKIARGQATFFKTIQEFLGIDYVGYVIEKERLDKKTGEWIRTDEYKVIGAEANSFVDTRVAYGETYRYRIKSILKLSKKDVVEGLSNFEVLEDIKRFESNKYQAELKRNQELINEIDSYTRSNPSRKSSSGHSNREIELSNGTSFRANNSFTDLVKNVNFAPDRWGARIKQNLHVEDVDLTRGNISDVDLQRILNKSLAQFTERKVDYVSCYFESNPSKNWTYVNIIENVPPPPPESIRITPSTSQKRIIISWLKPSNAQRDIKFFKVYRRNNLGEPWRLLSEFRELDINDDGSVDPIGEGEAKIPADTNLFIDKNVQPGVKYIYALSCVDVHEIESFMSVQIQAELNPNFLVEKEEKPLKWISGSGARLDEVDFVYKKFLNRTEQIIAKKNIVISPNTRFSDTRKNLLIRITSLDTHEKKEINVALKNVNIREVQI